MQKESVIKWFSPEERLPDNQEHVLVILKKGKPKVCEFHTGQNSPFREDCFTYFSLEIVYALSDVIAWAQLPNI